MTGPLQEWLRQLRPTLIAFLTTRSLNPFPLLHDWAHYTPGKFKADFWAGLNSALLAVPQGMALAAIAEVPIYYGITCSAVAAFVASPFSGSRHTILGPTNGTAFMVFGFFATLSDPSAKLTLLPLLVFLVGLILVAGAYLRIADLIQYISRSVVVGYVTGAAILIMGQQARQVLGIDFLPDEPRPRTFFGVISFLFHGLPGTHWQSLLLGALTAVIFLVLRRHRPRWPVFAMSLLLASLTYVALHLTGFRVATFEPFHLANLWPRVPSFPGGMLDDISLLLGIAISVAFLAALENSVMSKTLASRSGDRPDPNQDMLSIGIANLVTSFFSVLPASGSLTRSQLNFASGAQTRMAGVFSGFLSAIGALLLAIPQLQAITWIPQCSLAALVICIASSLIHPRQIQICLAATRSDAAVTILTFLATLLLPLHQAVFLGVAVSIMLYLRKASRPELTEYHFTEEGEVHESSDGSRQHPLISLVHVEGELFFGAAELLRGQIQRSCSDPNLRVIILRMRNAHRLDATSVMTLEDLARFLRSSGRHLILSGTKPEGLGVLKRAGSLESIGAENVFAHDPQRPNWSTREALKHAQALIGTGDADVRIFYDPTAKRKGS